MEKQKLEEQLEAVVQQVTLPRPIINADTPADKALNLLQQLLMVTPRPCEFGPACCSLPTVSAGSQCSPRVTNSRY